jgi:hypothetical protein
MWTVRRCYEQNSLKQEVLLSSAREAEQRWHCRLYLLVVSWKSACEEKTRWLVWNGRQPATQSAEKSSVREAGKKRVSCRSAAVKRRLYMWYLECIIQWDCYTSFCAKILCHETASGDCNRLRILVRVRQWSVSAITSCVFTWSINPKSNPKPRIYIFTPISW